MSFTCIAIDRVVICGIAFFLVSKETYSKFSQFCFPVGRFKSSDCFSRCQVWEASISTAKWKSRRCPSGELVAEGATRYSRNRQVINKQTLIVDYCLLLLIKTITWPVHHAFHEVESTPDGLGLSGQVAVADKAIKMTVIGAVKVNHRQNKKCCLRVWLFTSAMSSR